jgi:hypothetical protein
MSPTISEPRLAWKPIDEDIPEADPENVGVSTFVSSDVGKLYMTLASIVGWKK